MSRTIDEKVVSMQFDNKQFERNVSTSMSTLEKLKQSLNLTGASKGLESINTAANNVNMSGLNSSVDSVRNRFSALEVMAVTALANITNSAVNTGKRLVSALTVDPIKDGLQEYETQMNAVQTILANTQKEGTNVDTVNKALDELNSYADKTIYNFTEMTRNIGTFTAAGVKLDTSVSSIKGIANLAAVSGSTSQQASTAMYQLSQAIASGTVKLADWNSVVNAGMGGQVFQDALIRTAEHLNTGAKAAIKAKGSFRESLQTGWLTTEVLTQTLDQFATAADTQEEYEAAVKKFVDQGYSQEEAKQMADMAKTAGEAATKVKTFTQLIDTLKEALGSGWTTSWRLIIGDFEEARELWTSVSDTLSEMINKSAEARNNMLQGWSDGGGRTMAIEALKNTFEGLVNIIKPIKEAFREIFPRTTSDQLIEVTERIKDLTVKFKELTEKNAPKLKSTFKGIFAVLDIGVTIIKKVVGGVAKLIGNLTGLSGGILGITGSIGDWLSGVRDSIKESDIFGKVINAITGFIQKAIDKIKEFASAVREKFASPGFEGFLGVINGIWNALKLVTGKIIKVAKNIGKAIAGAFRSGDIKSVFDALNGGAIFAILMKVKKWISGITESFDGSIKLVDRIKEVLDSVKDSLTAWQQNLKANVLLKLAAAIGILAVSLVIIATIDPDKLAASLKAITVLFVDLVVAIAAFDKIGGNFKGASKASLLMIGMATAVLIMAGALKKLSDLSWEQLGKGLTGIFGLTSIVVGAMALLSKFVAKSEKIFSISKNGLFSSKTKRNFISIGIAIIAISVAMKIFASAVKDLAQLDWGGLAKGLTGVGAIMLEVIGFFGLMKLIKPEKMISSSLALIAIAGAMKIFASVAKDFAEMDWTGLAKAGTAIGGILFAVAVFAKIIGGSSSFFTASKNGIFSKKTSNGLLSMSISLIAIAGAMKIFASAAKDFASLSWNELAKAGAAIGGILIAIAGFINIVPPSAKLIKMGAGLVVIAVSMKMFSSAAKSFAEMDWTGLAKAGAAIGGILLAVGLFAATIGKSSSVFSASRSGIFSAKTSKNLLALSISLIAVAIAMKIFAGVMKDISSLSWSDVAKGLLTFAGALTIFGVAAAVLRPIIPAMYALSGAILVFGIGCALAGAGILAVSIAIGSLGVSILTVASSIVETIKTIVEGLGSIIVAACTAIADSAGAIGEAIVAVIVAVCDTIIVAAPKIADTFFKLLVEGLTLLKTYIPQLVNLLVDVIVSLLDSLTGRMPEIINSLMQFIASFFNTLNDALGQGGLENLLKSIRCVSDIFFELAIAAKIASTIPITGALTAVVSMAEFIGGVALILTALGELTRIPGFEWVIGEGSRVLGQIGTAIGSFVGNIISSFAVSATSGLPQIGQNLSDFMTNTKVFIDGAKSIDSSILDGVATLAKAVLAITASDVISGLASWLTGGSSIVSFGKDLSEFGPYFKQYADSIVGIDSSAITASATAAMALSTLASSLPKEGGLVSWFVGENSIASFGEQLVEFGVSLKEYSNSVSGVDAAAVTASAVASKALAEMADTIPNQGGIVAWFAGDNSIAAFGDQLVHFGSSLKAYAENVTGINLAAIITSVIAAKALAEMADTIPNQGGIVAWFAGENSLASFSEEIISFGKAMKSFSSEVAGIEVESVSAAATAGKALAEMADMIPNTGGLLGAIVGNNDLGTFADQFPLLGKGLRDFADNIGEFTGTQLATVTCAADAIKLLAEASSEIPNSGGLLGAIVGNNDLGTFADQFPNLGSGLRNFADNIGEFTDTQLAAVNSAAYAIKTLAQASSEIPNSGGLLGAIVGNNDLGVFANQFPLLGTGLAGFLTNVGTFTEEQVKTVECAANAIKLLAEASSKIPNSGGLLGALVGNNDLGTFADQFPNVGTGLSGFAANIGTFSEEQMATIESAANAIKILAQAADEIPNSGGLLGAIVGNNDLGTFADQFPNVGTGLSGFVENLGTFSESELSSINAGVEAIKVISELAGFDLSIAQNNINTFGSSLSTFGEKLADFCEKLSGIDLITLTTAINRMDILIDVLDRLEGVDSASAKNFKDAINELGKTSVKKFIDSFTDSTSATDVKSAAATMLSNFIEGAESKGADVDSALETIATSGKDAIENKPMKELFRNAGKYLGDGLIEGINAKQIEVRRAAFNLGRKAVQGELAGQVSSSPSKLTIQAGKWFGEGLVIGIDKMGKAVYSSGHSLGETAVNSLSSTISRISDAVSTDIDAQPTIRPVLDLSDVRSGAGAIEGMLGVGSSIGVMSRVGAISSSMNRLNQNGVNDDVISAINKLRKDLSNVGGNSYTINGLTYDDGSNVSDAIKAIVRAAKVERRI